MQQSSKDVVIRILEARKPASILDAPCGAGWLREQYHGACAMDGVDLYEDSAKDYRKVHAFDLGQGLPETGTEYECVCCCEGIEHFGNPQLFFEHSMKRLQAGGMLVVTTPNVWYPASKVQYFLRGFFPSFPCLAGKIVPGSHMHIMPWSFPQLYLYLKLAGFTDIRLHQEPMSKPKHLWERILGMPQRIYCRGKIRKATDPEVRSFWENAASEGSIFGRHLIVTAVKPGA